MAALFHLWVPTAARLRRDAVGGGYYPLKGEGRRTRSKADEKSRATRTALHCARRRGLLIRADMCLRAAVRSLRCQRRRRRRCCPPLIRSESLESSNLDS